MQETKNKKFKKVTIEIDGSNEQKGKLRPNENKKIADNESGHHAGSRNDTKFTKITVKNDSINSRTPTLLPNEKDETKNKRATVSAERPFSDVKIIHRLTNSLEELRQNCISRFHRGRNVHYDMGDAARIYRDKELWRATHETFEESCLPVLGMRIRKVQRFIAFASHVDDLRPIGRVPTHESQVRCLTKVNSEQRQQIWKRALDYSQDPTAFDVLRAGLELKVFKKRKRPRPTARAAEKALNRVLDYFEACFETEVIANRKHWVERLRDLADRYHVLATMKQKKAGRQRFGANQGLSATHEKGKAIS